MGDVEVQHQRHRTRLVHEVTREFDVLTSLTPVPNHLLCFYFVGCVKEVNNLINHPVVSLFASRVSGTGANVVVKSVYGELFATTGRERKLRQCRYCCIVVIRCLVYYESIKSDLKTKLISECRCDERLKTRVEESTRLVYTVLHDKTN